MSERLNIKHLLARHGLHPKRSWSQNFLVDGQVLEAIAEAAVLPGERCVELGAGLGALTACLARRAERVVAVERDRDLARVLRAEFAEDGRVEVLEANAATLDWTDLQQRFGRPLVVVGNLPYHMASQILFRLLDEPEPPGRWLFMLQREMAVRVVAEPGGREWGVLSVRAQMRCQVATVLDVPPQAFHPAPRVWSRVVSFEPLAAPRVAVRDEALFRRLVQGLFRQRRKTLRNGLRSAFGAELTGDQIAAMLTEVGMDAMVRAERLSLVELARLCDALGERLSG